MNPPVIQDIRIKLTATELQALGSIVSTTELPGLRFDQDTGPGTMNNRLGQHLADGLFALLYKKIVTKAMFPKDTNSFKLSMPEAITLAMLLSHALNTEQHPFKVRIIDKVLQDVLKEVI